MRTGHGRAITIGVRKTCVTAKIIGTGIAVTAISITGTSNCHIRRSSAAGYAAGTGAATTNVLPGAGVSIPYVVLR